MLETPRGVLDALAVGTASSRVTVLAMGTNDLTDEIGASRTPDRASLATALSWCLLAARAAGTDVLDGVHVGADDGFAAVVQFDA